MIEIPFTKLHGAENDFILTWAEDAPAEDLPELARRICERYTGVGGDGWMLVERIEGRGIKTRLFNSDGSEPEISGNGTRCAAAFALLHNAAASPVVHVMTAAGEKKLCVLKQSDRDFLFEMDMGQPTPEDVRATVSLSGRNYDATILNVGNPQCAIFVDEFPANWPDLGREAEKHPRFAKGSNVSFVKVVDEHAIEVLFFERGAGETRSSGTGSTGAAAAAILRKACVSPVEVRTPAGSLHFRWEESMYLTGPAALIAEGRFFVEF